MVASRATVEHVMDVLEVYLQREIIRAVLKDLSYVKGNASYRQTISALLKEYERRKYRS